MFCDFQWVTFKLINKILSEEKLGPVILLTIKTVGGRRNYLIQFNN